MKTYLEFQKEVKEIILKELRKPPGGPTRLGNEKTRSKEEQIALECAEQIAYKVHHEVHPFGQDPEFQGGYE